MMLLYFKVLAALLVGCLVSLLGWIAFKNVTDIHFAFRVNGQRLFFFYLSGNININISIKNMQKIHN